MFLHFIITERNLSSCADYPLISKALPHFYFLLHHQQPSLFVIVSGASVIRDVQSVNRLKIGVFQSDIRVEGSNRHQKIFLYRTPINFSRSQTKSPELAVKFVFGRSVRLTVENRSCPIGSEDRRPRPLLENFSDRIGRSRVKLPELAVMFC